MLAPAKRWLLYFGNMKRMEEKYEMMTPSSTIIKENSIKRIEWRGDKGRSHIIVIGAAVPLRE